MNVTVSEMAYDDPAEVPDFCIRHPDAQSGGTAHYEHVNVAIFAYR
jgi:hypothetical protein